MTTKSRITGIGLFAAALVVLCAMAGCAKGSKGNQAAVIPAQAAAKAFKEASSLCQAEGGKLWGQSLCGPMMFADAATHQAVLNGPSTGAVRDGEIFRLALPAEMGLANTSQEVGGQRWTMILWPLPQDSGQRGVLMMHESYHRIQPALGLIGGSGMGTNGHLDTRDGRVWLRAQFHALAAALRSGEEARRSAISDALLFEAYRRSLWPEAAAEERNLELNEGLAESTGIDASLAEPAARIKAALADLSSCEGAPSFVRSFAYGTGPAYAELLDAADPGWRKKVHGDFDFGVAVAEAYKISPQEASKTSAESALARYGGSEIVAQEDTRQKSLEERNARYTNLFLKGPTVGFRLEKMSISYNPREVASFEGHGSVYGTLQISDLWGTLKVEGGAALVSKDFKAVFVPASADTTAEHLAGKGWTVTLAKGYTLAPNPAKAGSFVVVPK